MSTLNYNVRSNLLELVTLGDRIMCYQRKYQVVVVGDRMLSANLGTSESLFKVFFLVSKCCYVSRVFSKGSLSCIVQ